LSFGLWALRFFNLIRKSFVCAWLSQAQGHLSSTNKSYFTYLVK